MTRRMLDQGHAVATFSRRKTPPVEELEQTHGDRFWFAEADAADASAMAQFVSDAIPKLGGIDALVNNAAVAMDGVLALTTDASIEQMLDINLKAAIVLARETSRRMLAQQSGSIVNVASIIAERGFSGLSVYAATKAGLIGMTRSLARELGPRNIRVNAIAPGYLETEMSSSLEEVQRAQIIRRTPLGRLGTVDDVTPLVDFLISPSSAFITGQVFVVDGGSSV